MTSSFKDDVILTTIGRKDLLFRRFTRAAEFCKYLRSKKSGELLAKFGEGDSSEHDFSRAVLKKAWAR